MANWKTTLVSALAAMSFVPAAAQVEPEELRQEVLAERMQPRWVWVNDVSFDRMMDGRAYLLDADSGKFLGMVSAGYSHGALQISPKGDRIAVPETYFSRGSRGERTDVVTFYDTKTLAPGGEVTIPPKRYSGLPFHSTMPTTDDGRFSLVYNFTPEQSVTVVDLEKQALVGEFQTPGCGLIYPTANRRFFMLCADGSLLLAALADDGKISITGTTPEMFDAEKDPVTEKAVRIGSSWVFVSFSGKVVVIDGSKAVPKRAAEWSLTDPSTKGWRIGGLQPIAYHAPSGRLFTLMHEGGEHTHKDPGTEVWVFDYAKRRRVARLALGGMATSIAVSGDKDPLLYTTMFGETNLNVFDAQSGKKLRRIGGLGHTMTVIQPAPVGGK